jgi:hypothetical protein
MTLADTAVELQDGEALSNYAPELERLAIRDQHKLYLAIAHRAFGVRHRIYGEQAPAQTRLMQALELFNQLGARWQIGRTLFELGALTLTVSPMKAREYYSRALGYFEEMNAAPYAERTRVALDSWM